MTPEDHQEAMCRDMRGVRTPDLLHYRGHHHQSSRRQFLRASGLLVGAVATGLPWGRGTTLAAKPGSGIPSQLPDFSPVMYAIFSLEIPWFLPDEVDPFTSAIDSVANPTSIWDFNGSFGLIEANGVSDPHRNSESIARRWSCDVRFMTGMFRDRAGRIQQGTFCNF
jgi:hypothetical protein